MVKRSKTADLSGMVDKAVAPVKMVGPATAPAPGAASRPRAVAPPPAAPVAAAAKRNRISNLGDWAHPPKTKRRKR